MSVPVLRFFARTRSEIYDILPYAYMCPDKEIQIVLAFARDYNEQGKYTNGKFFTYLGVGDDKITPQVIQDIKNVPGSIKFFLSIGGRDTRFPFAVNSNDKSTTWISNAEESLRTIIQEYYIDGIDVYYEHINEHSLPFFPTSIVPLMDNLKGGQNSIITKTSITVSYPLRDIYGDLRTHAAELLDYAVYQCFTVTVPIHTPQDLVRVFHELRNGYPREKTIVGYSNYHGDQTLVTPEIFVGALPQLLREEAIGISMWYGKPAP